MSWHHVAALTIAAVMVVLCAQHVQAPGGKEMFSSVVQLATVVVAGVFGHAGARMGTHRKEGEPK